MCRSAPVVCCVQEQELGFLGNAAHGESSKWDIADVVNGKQVLFKVDTGAGETVLPEGFFRSCFKGQQLHPARRPLDGPNGRPLKVTGIVRVQMTFKSRESSEEVYILRTLSLPLLGKPAIEKLNVLGELVARIGKIANANPNPEYPDLFEGPGTLKDEYHGKLKPDAKPFALTSPRRAHLPLYAKTKQELFRMQAEGVISPVTEPTSW